MKSFKMASLLMFAVFALSIISSASAATTTATPTTQVNINTHLNDKFKINLVSNPSTAYSWILKYNHKFLKLVSSKYTPSKTHLIGAPGVQNYVFKAIKKGNTTIDLVYVKVFDMKHPGKKIIYHVKITK